MYKERQSKRKVKSEGDGGRKAKKREVKDGGIIRGGQSKLLRWAGEQLVEFELEKKEE